MNEKLLELYKEVFQMLMQGLEDPCVRLKFRVQMCVVECKEIRSVQIYVVHPNYKSGGLQYFDTQETPSFITIYNN